MGSSAAIPPGVECFVLDCIPSVVHMEALLLLKARPEEELYPDTIAASLFIDEKTTRRALDDLVGRGLVHAGGSGGPFRFSPRSPELRVCVDELAETYRTRLVPLSRFIHERAEARSLENFANAFRLRKD